MDSFPSFPRSAVHPETEACLTSEIETGSGDPSPYGRPRGRDIKGFKSVMVLITKKEKKIT